MIEEQGASFADEVAAIRPILEDAVRLRMIADVPVGVFLSGGIDSSAVVALATRASEAPVHSFTVTFDEERYSEAPYAAEVARRYGCDHHRVHFPAARAIGELDRALRALDQPSVDGVNTYFVSEAAREAGLTVALSGLGGDEVFAGYRNFRLFGQLRAAARAANLLPSALHRAIGLAVSGAAERVPQKLRKVSHLLAGDGSAAATYAALRAMFTPDERSALTVGLEDPGSSGVSCPADLERLSPVNAYSALELSNYLRDTLLRDADAMSMAHSLEVRVPLLDHVLIERVMRVPGALRDRRGGQQAAAHRRRRRPARGGDREAEDGLHPSLRRLVQGPAAPVDGGADPRRFDAEPRVPAAGWGRAPLAIVPRGRPVHDPRARLVRGGHRRLVRGQRRVELEGREMNPADAEGTRVEWFRSAAS